MIGWLPVKPIAGGHADVEQCQGPLCGAYVRRSQTGRREEHDRQFHIEDKPEANMAHDLREALVLLAAKADDSSCQFDHHGDCQQHGWCNFDQARGCPEVRIRYLITKHDITDEEIDTL